MINKVLFTALLILTSLQLSYSQSPVLTSNTGHNSSVRDMAFSADGKYLATIGDDYYIKIWDIQKGRLLRSIEFKKQLYRVEFSRDGKSVILGKENEYYRWDILSGKLIGKVENFNIMEDNISPDKKYKAEDGNEREVKLVNNSTNEVLKVLDGNEHSKYLSAYAFSHDNKLLASGDSDGLIKLWNIPDGTDAGISFSFGSSWVDAIAFSSDNEIIAVSATDIVLWDVKSGKKIKTLKGQSGFEVLSFGQNNSGNNIFINSYENNLSVYYDLKDGNTAKIFKTQLILNANDYNFISTDSTSISLWDAKTGNYIKLLKKSGLLSPDGKTCAYSTESNEIKVYNIQTGKVTITLSGHKEKLKGMNFSHDGKYLISSDNDVINMWSLKTGMIIKTINSSWNDEVVLSPDNSYIISYENSMQQYVSSIINVFNTLSGELIRTFYTISWDIENIVSKDEKYLINTKMHEVIVSDIETGKEVLKIKGFSSPLFNAKFVSDDKYIVTITEDATLEFWETKTGKKIALQKILIDYENKTFNYFTYTPDGRFDGTEEGMNSLHFVQGMNILPVSSFFEHYYTPRLLERVLSGEILPPVENNLNNLKLPPIVEITFPDDGIKLSSKTTAVNVSITDQGGGIDEIRLYQNGKLISSTQRGFKPVEQKGDKVTKTFNVTLTNGENIFKATAFSMQRTESVPDEISVFYNGSQISSDLYLLVIGINKYKNSKYNLNFANADANAFIQQIKSGSQSIFGKAEIIHLSDSEATKLSITQAFTDLKLKVKPDDVFIFYYAGHGVMSEEQKSRFFIVPHEVTQLYGNNQLLNTNGLSEKEILSFSKDLKAQKQLFILDACQSGGMVDLLASRGAAEEKAIAQLARSSGTFWLTASGSKQFATEFAILGHGVFTYAVLQALKGDADGGKKDKKITVKEISAFLNDAVPELSEKYKGEAQYPTSYGFGQDFPIIIVK